MPTQCRVSLSPAVPRERGQLLEVAANPRHLGADIGFLSILHTWGQTLVRHPHVHCVVPAGGFSVDNQRWVHPKYAGFFLPVKVLSRVFRGKFVEGLRRACARGELDLSGATAGLREPVRWHAFVDALVRTDWVVYAKPAFGGPAAVLRYLGRYTHCAVGHRRMSVPISDTNLSAVYGAIPSIWVRSTPPVRW